MSYTLTQAFTRNFLGQAPQWYKLSMVTMLIINPILLMTAGPFVTGWVLIGEFIFTLAMALKCYPLQPGGLLAIEAIVLGMASPEAVYHEALGNFEVIMLLMFMVAGIYFMQSLLLFVFTKIILGVRSKIAISLLFCLLSAFLSAFLDALTVIAVLITVAFGFYNVYHKVASSGGAKPNDDSEVTDLYRQDLEQFRSFLRSLLMHGAVGTALGGVCTLVGEPQNLLIAEKASWNFIEFFLVMAPVTIPVFISGIVTVIALEATKSFGYGQKLPESVRNILVEREQVRAKERTLRDKSALFVQAIVAVYLVIALATHMAPVGLVGLSVIVLLTAFNGIIEEHQIGSAFEEALPFTALLIVFFAIVAVIHEQHLFQPIIHYVLSLDPSIQPIMFFTANGLLSAISDNVFVATVYINEVKAALDSGAITREHFDALAVAVNTGTNIPSVATPNGQAAFLFLLTSAIAPLLRLSYGRMVIMALPYTIVMSTVAALSVLYLL
ncbi:sodium/proton antiporter (NhaB family) [Sinobacterium caligoides]|uniref:Na(+)/H(+) antiporter NhaB n=1 Tax=Sinobacterium caligoides TaxID=933926 RepID=A0A3N2DJY2_9GAMM|nr:sodium/proton antiporter NhaB [Sinobacterium caligoides]ROR99981.1 sodium/proton antiporter (NhaB family) [Sinobacterium caligoides]